MPDALGPPDKTSPRGDVEFRRNGDDLIFTWPAYTLTATLSRLRDRADGPTGELLLSHAKAGRIFWGHLTLASTAARETLVRKLKRDLDPRGESPGVFPNWSALLDNLCYMAAHELRTDGSFVQVGADDLPQRSPFLIRPLLVERELNLLYGASGAGKGYLATALALMAHSRLPVLDLPVPADETPVLYCDWEWGPEEATRRVQAVCRGGGYPRQTMTYRRCAGVLADQIDMIRAEVRRREVRLVLVDSVEMAAGRADGGDPAGPFLRMAAALRSLAVTTLLIDHPAKHAERGAETPYGSRYKLALCRNIWVVRKTRGGPGELHVGLWHDENSNIAHQPPLGFRLLFAMDETDPTILRGLTFHREDVRDIEGFSDLLTDWQKLRPILVAGPAHEDALAEEIGKSSATVRVRLNERRRRHRDVDRLPAPDNRWFLVNRTHEAPGGHP